MTPEDLLVQHRNHFAAYHHHKEQMGYAATTVYLGALAYALFNTPSSGPMHLTPLRWIFLILTAMMAVFFVIWQLRNRSFAADMVQACNCLLARSLSRPFTDAERQVAFLRGHQYPTMLVDEFNGIRRSRRLLGGPKASEAITYAAMAFWTLFALWGVLGWG